MPLHERVELPSFLLIAKLPLLRHPTTVLYNITKENGDLNVAENDLLTVTGLLSTTFMKDFALGWGQGASLPANNQIILAIKPLTSGSKGAFLDYAISANGQYEVLFPTNVKFRIDKIFDRSDGGGMDPDVKAYGYLYEIWLEETNTSSIVTEVDGADPRSSEYVCEDPDKDSDSSSNSGGSGSTKSSGQTVSAASRPLFVVSPFFVFVFVCLKLM